MAQIRIFVGSFLIGISVLIAAMAVLMVQLIDTANYGSQANFSFFPGLLIYVPGIIAGIGIGMAFGGEEEYKNANTALGAVGIAGVVAFTFWFSLLSSDPVFPITGIVMSLIAATVAFIGLWIMIVAYFQE
ncbi:MAG: hypothetical protein ACTSP4_06370 [Candidatus Hodarchaeales archaeon]